jgi:cephalosporin hydroxylase
VRLIAKLPPARPSPVRVLFSGRNSAASWTIRGEQVAACREGWAAKRDVDDAELEGYDALCIVKRPDPELIARARARGLPVVFDALDSWAQPDDGLRVRDREAALALFRDRWAPYAWDAVIFPNRAMREHLGALAIASAYVYHHSLPGLEPNPWREAARTVGYVGDERYLGPWAAVLERACDERGLRFVINPPSFRDIDVGVCVRGGEHDSFLANEYKSNVKLANLYGAAIPALAGVKERSCHETDDGHVRFFGDEAQLRAQLGALLDPERRRAARERALETREAFRIERIVEQYEAFFVEVVRRHRLAGRPRPEPPSGLERAARLAAQLRQAPRKVRWAVGLPAENRVLARRLDDERARVRSLKADARELEAEVARLQDEAREARAFADTEIIRKFHVMFYDRAGWKQGTWAGVPILKNPLDLFLYQELIFRRRPRFIVELGANKGGSALFFAHMLDLLGGDGRVLSVSIDDAWAPAARGHPRIETFAGSSVDPGVVREVVSRVGSSASCLVNLDSDHRRDHVLAELAAYADLPGPGDYLIVEDGNVNGHPVRPEYGPGPSEAVDAFLSRDARYQRDVELEERYLLTFAVKGFLRRC